MIKDECPEERLKKHIKSVVVLLGAGAVVLASKNNVVDGSKLALSSSGNEHISEEWGAAIGVFALCQAVSLYLFYQSVKSLRLMIRESPGRKYEYSSTEYRVGFLLILIGLWGMCVMTIGVMKEAGYVQWIYFSIIAANFIVPYLLLRKPFSVLEKQGKG